MLLVAALIPGMGGCRAVLGIEDLGDDSKNSTFPDGSDGDRASLDAAGVVRDQEGSADAPSRHDVAGPTAIDASVDVRDDLDSSSPDAGPDATSILDAAVDVGPTVAHLTVSQAALDFGTLVQKQSANSGQVLVTNTGTATTAPLTTAITGAGFSIATDGCSGKTLGPSLGCTISVALSTASVGVFTGGVTVRESTSNAATETLTAHIVSPGAVSVAPTSESFAGVPLGSQSAPATFTVRNTGMAATGALGVTVGGANASEFALVDGCTGQVLAVAGSCAITITFSPVTAGPKTASVGITASPGGTGTASLSGSGLAPALLSISPTSFAFPTVSAPIAGSPSIATFTITNAGDADSAALAAAVVAGAGTATGDFAITRDTCSGGSLAGMSTCGVTVGFQPAARGAKVATLELNGGPPSATLTGSAQDQVLLSVTTGGLGTGTVVDGAGTISCPTTCSEQIMRGITSTPTATLTATPKAGSVFTGWTGACSGTIPTCTVAMSAAESVGAQFGLAPVTLSLTMSGYGPASQSISSAPAGIRCTAGRSCTTSASYNIGTSVVLTVPAGGTGLYYWGGACSGTSPTCTVSMSAAKSVTLTLNDYNYVFITSSAFPATFGSLAAADKDCAAAATAAGLPGHYTAFLSTSTVNASTRFGSARGWIRVDGLPFGDTMAELVGTHQNYYPIAVNELGQSEANQCTWTGTQTDGTAAPGETCGDWTIATGIAQAGFAAGGSLGWLDCTGECAFDEPLYCFGTDLSTPLTITPTAGRRVFVSRSTWTPSTGITAADVTCRGDATAAGLTNAAGFIALLATPTASAASRLNANGSNWVRLDGIPIAASTADFVAGNVLAPIVVDSSGSFVELFGPATGALSIVALGTAATTCNGWTSQISTDTFEYGADSSIRWFASGTVVTCADVAQVYCIEP